MVTIRHDSALHFVVGALVGLLAALLAFGVTHNLACAGSTAVLTSAVAGIVKEAVDASRKEQGAMVEFRDIVWTILGDLLPGSAYFHIAIVLAR